MSTHLLQRGRRDCHIEWRSSTTGGSGSWARSIELQQELSLEQSSLEQLYLSLTGHARRNLARRRRRSPPRSGGRERIGPRASGWNPMNRLDDEHAAEAGRSANESQRLARPLTHQAESRGRFGAAACGLSRQSLGNRWRHVPAARIAGGVS